MAVKLPGANQAVVAKSKIVDYLLAVDHPEGTGKAAFFRSFGFNPEDWEALARALVRHAEVQPATAVEHSPYGTKYLIEGPLPCPDGRSPRVVAVWIIETGSQRPRLVTAYPGEYSA